MKQRNQRSRHNGVFRVSRSFAEVEPADFKWIQFVVSLIGEIRLMTTDKQLALHETNCSAQKYFILAKLVKVSIHQEIQDSIK